MHSYHSLLLTRGHLVIIFDRSTGGGYIAIAINKYNLISDQNHSELVNYNSFIQIAFNAFYFKFM